MASEPEPDTERRQAHEQLLDAEHLFRTLVEQIPAITYMYTETAPGSGRFTTNYNSPQFERILGYPPNEWQQNPDLWLSLLHPDDREGVLAEEERTNRTGEPFRMEYRLVARDGHVVWVWEQGVLVRDEPGQPRQWLGVINDITERKEAEERLVEALQRLRESEAERRKLLEQMVRSTEEERRRIALELHDRPIQHLTALDYTLETLRMRMGGRDELVEEALRRAQRRVREDIQELRNVMTELRPPVLDERGLEFAVRNHVDSTRAESGIACTFESRLGGRLDPASEIVLYRVAQEALSNVVRHSRARHAWVTMRQDDGAAVLEVRDDGVGMDPIDVRGAVDAGHYGLVTMRERIEMAGGTWELVSHPGSGTIVRAVVPIGDAGIGSDPTTEEEGTP